MKNKRGLKIHIGKAHKVLKTPKKERFPAVEKEPVLTLSPTPVSGREQEDSTSSPEKIIDSDDPNELTTCIKCHLKLCTQMISAFSAVSAQFNNNRKKKKS